MGLIQTAESIEQHVKDAYTALQQNGASLPEQRNLANLAGCIGENSEHWQYEDKLSYEGINGVAKVSYSSGSSEGAAMAFTRSCFSNDQKTTILRPAEPTSVQKSYLIEVSLDFEGATPIYSYTLGGAGGGYGFPSLTKVVAKNATKLGDRFCAWAISLETCLLENIQQLNTYAFFNCHALPRLSLPEGLLNVEPYFCVNCYNLTRVYVPASLQPPEANDTTSFTVDDPSAPAYATGITLTGPGAAAWAERLPDITTGSPLRKIILG